MKLYDLQTAADAGQIDTVLVAQVDMQGRLMGKRYHVATFLGGAYEETHSCNYLLATDLEMATPDGYAATSWRQGYGDYVMKPDLSTLRPAPWLEGTALVLCDVLDHQTHAPVPHSPRQVLKRQIDRLAEAGLTASMATELEFFLFEGSHDTIRQGGFRDLIPLTPFNADYSLQLTARTEGVMRPVRNHLHAAGIPVENSKGEAEAGQEELNIRHADPLACADHHAIAKHAVKDIAARHGHAASFLPKYHADRAGSSSHIHQSLWKDGENAFRDDSADLGMSDTMRHWMAGLIAHASDCTLLLAPYVNSYKRFVAGTFAPTRTAWSIDNRTAAFRLVGENSGGIRVECRIGGSDLNPYLACAAQIAAGLAGIEHALPLDPPFEGDVYQSRDIPEIPRNLRDAAAEFSASDMLRAAMGDDVVDHYTRMAEVELEDFDRTVTGYELARGFERA